MKLLAFFGDILKYDAEYKLRSNLVKKITIEEKLRAEREMGMQSHPVLNVITNNDITDELGEDHNFEEEYIKTKNSRRLGTDKEGKRYIGKDKKADEKKKK